MDTLLEAIDVCNVDGFCFGNYTDEEAGTGCTVIVAPEGATGGVDVRGGAPASRETDLLRPENTVDKVHAVCLSGGSAFGLEAASGVARELESRGIGLPVGPSQVPIVCSRCIFDLALGDPFAAAGSMQMPLDRTNTTISCIVTNVELTKAQATKVSQMAADAYAHAIRPTHTTNDGDTIYTLASGKLGAQASAAVPLDLLGMLAVRALQTAIVNGAKTAKTSHGIPGAAK